MVVLANAFVHPTEALLEEYCFRRIPEPTLSVLEEHLLVCEPCREELAGVDEYIRVVKTALQPADSSPENLPLRQPQLPYLQSHGFWPWHAMPLALPRLMGFGAAIVFLFFVAFAGWRGFAITSHRETAEVELAALRGGSSPDSTARATSGMALDLVMDRQRIPTASGYVVQVVDAEGREIWRGPAATRGPWLSVHLNQGLAVGKYWARLYTDQAELLSECGLEINAPSAAR